MPTRLDTSPNIAHHLTNKFGIGCEEEHQALIIIPSPQSHVIVSWLLYIISAISARFACQCNKSCVVDPGCG